MSHGNIDTIQIIPIPGNSFESNTITITEPINDNESKYDHIGEYIASSSSYSSDDNIPASAFNKVSNAFWQCDYAKNPEYNIHKFGYKKPYMNNPYIKSADGPSTYNPNGGGVDGTQMATYIGSLANKVKVSGEWLQIKLPAQYPVYLYKYSILTPPPMNGIITFPKSFVIVGSMDGTTWDYVDQQTMQKTVDTTNREPVVFNINSEKKFCYFRLIILSLFKQNDIIAINQWSLFGTPIPVINREGMVGYNVKSFSPSSNSLLNYTYYNHTKPILDENLDTQHSEVFITKNGEQKANRMNTIDNNITAHYLFILCPILATTLLLYAFSKKK
jgi:hypothetical protein